MVYCEKAAAERGVTQLVVSGGVACNKMLRAMLAHPRVRAARVATEKPDVYPDCDAVGCEVFAVKEAT